MNMAIELEKCPFCGHEAKFFSNRREFECFYCGAVVMFHGYLNQPDIKLIDRYNKRAHDAIKFHF